MCEKKKDDGECKDHPKRKLHEVGRHGDGAEDKDDE